MCGCLNTRHGARPSRQPPPAQASRCRFNRTRYGGYVVTTTEPSPAVHARPPLRVARERFLAGRPLPDGVPEEVLAAWRRARVFRITHDPKEPAPHPSPPGGAPLLRAPPPGAERSTPAP